MNQVINPEVIHFNTRLRAVKSAFFSRQELEDMLNKGDIAHLTETLLESQYRKEMAEALSRFHGADAVEEALTRNLATTYQLLIHRAVGEFKELVELFLARWDLAAVKSLIRCVHHGLTAEEAITSLIPGPKLTVPLLRDFAQAESVPVLIKQLAAWNPKLCEGLLHARQAYEEEHDPAPLEEALDRAYFVDNTRALAESKDPDAQRLLGFLRSEIDRINLRVIFQYVERQIQTANLSDRLLPEGQLSINFLMRMAERESVAGAMELLGKTPYRELVNELYELVQTHRFAPVERFFERILIRQIRIEARSNAFGIAVMMDYVWLKYNEVVNLRLIARGLTGHIPPGRVRSELYFV